MHVYIAEDDPHILQLLTFNLSNAGYTVHAFEDGLELEKALQDETPDFVILDIMMPGRDGIELLKLIRRTPRLQHVPVIMLTAKSEEFDRVLGLELGADDYVAKPFSVRELLARMKTILKRSSRSEQEPEQDVMKVRDLELDMAKHQVYFKGELLHCTLKEFMLLQYFMKHPDRVLTREMLLDKIWGYDVAVETRTVDVHIRRLRSMVGEGYIETVRGIGYRFLK